MVAAVDNSTSRTTPSLDTSPDAGSTTSGTGSSSVDGRGLVQQATNPSTGQPNTDQLARWVGEARQQDPALAQQAQGAIESELIAQGRIGDLSRFNQAVREQPQPLPGTYGVPGMLLEGGRQLANRGSDLLSQGQALTQAGTQQLIDNPILSKRWESTTSAWTGKGGFTQPLRDVLNGQQLDVVNQVNPTPPGSIGKNQGIPAAQANNTNGALARDAIADRYRAAGYQVQTEVPTNNGARIVDVRADKPAADPRLSERVDTESKAYRAGSSTHNRAEALQDGAELRANRAARASGEAMEEAGQALSRSGKALQTVGRVARPLGVVLGVVEVGQAFRADGNQIGENTGRAASGLAGGALGAWGGAAAGAAIGSVVPGVGTVVGAVVGGIIGGLAGDAGGRGLFDTVKSWF